jgi:hypothetical protein
MTQDHLTLHLPQYKLDLTKSAQRRDARLTESKGCGELHSWEIIASN